MSVLDEISYLKSFKVFANKEAYIYLDNEIEKLEQQLKERISMSQKVKIHEATQKAIIIHNKLIELNKNNPQLDEVVKETKVLVDELKMLTNIA
jgi:hypothetical protein